MYVTILYAIFMNLKMQMCYLTYLFYIQEGAILVFLPGWDNISTLHDLLVSQVMFKSGKILKLKSFL